MTSLNSSFTNSICRKYSGKSNTEYFLIIQEYFPMQALWPSLGMQLLYFIITVPWRTAVERVSLRPQTGCFTKPSRGSRAQLWPGCYFQAGQGCIPRLGCPRPPPRLQRPTRRCAGPGPAPPPAGTRGHRTAWSELGRVCRARARVLEPPCPRISAWPCRISSWVTAWRFCLKYFLGKSHIRQ